MELYINSPVYFSDHYGADDDVYRYCQRISAFFKDREYSETMSVIGIVPVAAPQELYAQGIWKETVQTRALGSCATICARMDFESYYRADSSEKIELIKEMILRAVKKVKSKGKFDWERFRDDIEGFHSACSASGVETEGI